MTIDDECYAECVLCGDPVDIFEDDHGMDRNSHYAHRACINQEGLRPVRLREVEELLA